MIMKLFRMRREYREWKNDPADKVAETGLDVVSTFLKLPIIVLSVIAVIAGFLFLVFGSKGFLVLFIFTIVPLAIWIWITISIRKFARRITRRATDNVSRAFHKSETVIDVDATEV